MRAVLICVQPDRMRRHLHPDQFPACLGTSPDAAVRIADRWASERHCLIEVDDGTLHVLDLDSASGTLVNGCRVCQSPLLPGDQLTVGAHVFRIVYERYSLSVPMQPVYERQ